MPGEYSFLLPTHISSFCSSETLRIVDSGFWILIEDFEAFRFAKKDLDGSRACLGVTPGELGKGGNDVKVGDMGEFGEADEFLETGRNSDSLAEELAVLRELLLGPTSRSWPLESRGISGIRRGLVGVL